MRKLALTILMLTMLSACSGGSALVAGDTSEQESPKEELLRLLAQGRGLTYNARYAVRSSEPSSGPEQTIEIWRAEGKVRQDTTSFEDGQSGRISSFTSGGTITQCMQIGVGPWTCSNSPKTAIEGPDSLASMVEAEIEGRTVSARSTEIDKRPVRCFVVEVTGDDPESEICLTLEGTPVRITFGPFSLELLTIKSRVDSKVFTPPAS